MSGPTIGRLRGGFCAYWTGPDGKRTRHQLKARSRAEAEPEALDVYRRHMAAPGMVRVSDCWDAYRASLGGRPAAGTLAYTGKAVLVHFGAYRPDHVDLDLCRDYARKRMAAGRSQGSVHTELGHLRSALRFAQRVGMIARAPHIERPAKPMPKDRWLTTAEVERLIDAAETPHIRLAILLMLGTAGRAGAILDLTWDRVDFERGQINLRLPDAVTRKGRAIVPMNRGLRAALSSALEAALSDYVVEYAGGRVKSIRKGFDSAVKRAGLEGVTQHTCRHSAAVHMASAGVPIVQIAQFLGHSNTATTFHTYARFAPEHLREAAEVLDFTRIRRA